MEQQVEGLIQEVADKPASSEDGVWETTQLDSAIGDLQRGAVVDTPECRGTGEEAAKCDGATAPRRGSRKKRRPKPPRVIPTIRVFVGTFVHSTEDNPLVILDRWMIGVDGGKIIFSQSVIDYKEMIEAFKLKEFEKECVFKLPEGSLMMPGFVDCHTHVVSYLLAGLRSKFDSIQSSSGVGNGINERRIRTMNVIANDKHAISLFTTYVTQALLNGTTCAAYNGSVVESAARLLVDTTVRLKQRAVVGLEMYYGDNRDDTHMFQLIKAHDVAQHVRRQQSGRVQPCLVLSKPLPDWLEARVADMAAELDVRLKLVVGDESSESLKDRMKGWVELDGSSSLLYHKKQSLLNNKQSMLVNCSQCSSRDLAVIADLGCPVIHCPSADLLSCQFNALQRLHKRNITVGLGTDLNTSHSVSMLDTIRTASLCLKLSTTCGDSATERKKSSGCGRGCGRDCGSVELNGPCSPRITEWKDNKEALNDEDDEAFDEVDDEDDNVTTISYKDLFRMATLGGATVLGLDDIIGNFEVGKEFDALLIEPGVTRSKFVVVSNFDTVQDIVEKFIFLGDDRNITQVYIAGERIL